LTKIVARHQYFIENLERLPSSPLRTVLLADLRDRLHGVEFELATLGPRVQAMYFYQALYDTVSAQSDRAVNLEAFRLGRLAPAPDSAAWVDWRPPDVKLDAASLSGPLRKELETKLHLIGSIRIETLPRLESLLGERFPVSQAVRLLVMTTASEVPAVLEEPTPLIALEHPPSISLESAELHRAETCGAKLGEPES